MTERTLNNDVLSYLLEIQELADAEFGVRELPDPQHAFEFTESEYMILYYAVKLYMKQAILNGTGGQIITACNHMLTRMLPITSDFTKKRIHNLNQIREVKTELELDYLPHVDSVPFETN